MAKKKLKIYKDLKQSLEDALAYQQGEQKNLRVTEILERPAKISPRA